MNPEALRIVDKGLAFDNNTIFYNGIKLNIKPDNPKVVSTSYRDYNVYWINNGLLYRNEVEMTKIDEQSFTVLSVDYFKDVNHVYYMAKVLEGADADSFIYDYQFCYDKNAVYVLGNKLILNGVIKPVNDYFCKNKSTVYKYNYDYLLNLEPLLDVHVDNAKAIPKTKYGIINDTLYYQDKKIIYTNVDTNHIKVFSNDIIGFDNKIFYKGIATDKFDYQSIKVLNNTSYECFLEDKNGRYNMGIQNNSLTIRPTTLKKRKEEPIEYTKISPLQIISNVLYQGTYPLAKQSLLTQKGMTDFDTLELVSVLKGYRMGCSRDTQSASNYYILRNDQGYWKLVVSRETTISFIGKMYKF